MISLSEREIDLRTMIEEVSQAVALDAYEKSLGFIVDFDRNIPPKLLGKSHRRVHILLNTGTHKCTHTHLHADTQTRTRAPTLYVMRVMPLTRITFMSLTRLTGDGELLRKVFTNLVLNAIKYTRNGNVLLNVRIATPSPPIASPLQKQRAQSGALRYC